MTEAMPFLQKYDITFLRPPPICRGLFACRNGRSTVISCRGFHFA